MKFSNEHYSSLKNCVNNFLSEKQSTLTDIKKDLYADKSETRFLWDIFWASAWNRKHSQQYYDGNYADAHIQTAMKNIVAEILENEIGVYSKIPSYEQDDMV